MKGKRLTQLVILGLAAAALGAPSAQAMPTDLTGPEVRAMTASKVNAVHAKATASKVRYARRKARG